MATRDRNFKPKTELENLLCLIRESDLLYNIELARVMAKKHGMPEAKVDELLGPQFIIIDRTFLKERDLLKRDFGIVKNVLMFLNRRFFASKNMQKLIKLTGHGLILNNK